MMLVPLILLACVAKSIFVLFTTFKVIFEGSVLIVIYTNGFGVSSFMAYLKPFSIKEINKNGSTIMPCFSFNAEAYICFVSHLFNLNIIFDELDFFVQ